jgi:hypothetical protein
VKPQEKEIADDVIQDKKKRNFINAKVGFKLKARMGKFKGLFIFPSS